MIGAVAALLLILSIKALGLPAQSSSVSGGMRASRSKHDVKPIGGTGRGAARGQHGRAAGEGASNATSLALARRPRPRGNRVATGRIPGRAQRQEHVAAKLGGSVEPAERGPSQGGGYP